MTEPKPRKRPGELFIDRYMPTATEAEREDAYVNLRGLIAILVAIDNRIAHERRNTADSRESDP